MPRRRRRHTMTLPDSNSRASRSVSSNSHKKISVFKSVQETPAKYSGHLYPVNLEEQKERFLRHGIVPKFVLRGQQDADGVTNKDRGQIRFSYYAEAKQILDAVKKKFGDGSKFLEATYGKRIDYIEASGCLAEYLKDHSLEGEMTVYWTPDLTCSARMMWHGPNLRYNKPEARKYTLIIKNAPENNFLREEGIMCLANHEIGTHYFRMLNDGFQPWFSDRKKFGLRGMTSRESVATEEGLATINTVLKSKCKYLWTSALLYYTACKAAEMSFRELYEDLDNYIGDADQRWKHVMRVKRGVKDANDNGGYGNDQCYFEGAVEILRQIDKIDFTLLYSGKLCLDELNRVKRLSRLDCVKLPHFLKDVEQYKRLLRQVAYLNGLVARPVRKPTLARPCKRRLFPRARGVSLTRVTPPNPQVVSLSRRDFTGSSSDVSMKEYSASEPANRTYKCPDVTESVTERLKAPPKGKAPVVVMQKENNEPNGSLECTERLLNRPVSSPNKVKCSKSKDAEALSSFGFLERRSDVP